MKSNVTEIIFLLDRSGSMAGLESDTIGGFNAFIEKQAQMEGHTLVTTVLFDDKYEILYNGVAADRVKLTAQEYFVRGSTALLDAVGKTILEVGQRLSQVNEEKKAAKVIFVITTDGLENASREFSYQKVKELIRHQQEKYHWDFIFLGANIDVAKEARNMGIDTANAYSFLATKEGVEHMYCNACAAVSDMRRLKQNKRS